MALALEQDHSLPSSGIQTHRQQNNPSKLPSFRFADAKIGASTALPTTGASASASPAATDKDAAQVSAVSPSQRLDQGPQQPYPRTRPRAHLQRRPRIRTSSTSAVSTGPRPSTADSTSPSRRPRTSPGAGAVDPPPCITFQSKPVSTRKPPASRPRNGINLDSRPPLTMSTQRSYSLEQSRTPSTSNTDAWVANQQTISLPPSVDSKSAATPPAPRPHTLAVDEPRSSRTKISPIRQFKPSRNSIHSADMGTDRLAVQDNDVTLRALEGFSQRTSTSHEQDEQNSDDSDLFLKMAREEELARQQETSRDGNFAGRSNSRRSRIGLDTHRQSLPASTTYQSTLQGRRGSAQESTLGSRIEGEEGMAKALTYQSSARDRLSALDDLGRSRSYGGNSRSTPTTPRSAMNRDNRDISPESQAPYSGRRPSIPDHTSVLPRTSSYRQSNLSYSASRTYNSSPLVSRSMDINENPETSRTAEGTESTTSTTAPSTVWDELEDLKSRIHRLELTGKLPPTSGAAVLHASGERPPTATTTVTTMSSSPKRNSDNSNASPTDPTTVPSTGDNHPLLQAALAKSKPLLNSDIYAALEATTLDALAIAAMMGTSGQPGPISSSQSTIGGVSSVSDRQVRRKADSMCRSLTELCLALSEVKNEPAQTSNSQITIQTQTHDEELQQSIEVSPTTQQRQPAAPDLARVKASPRALSRLEARRSSMLATSGLPSPKYSLSEAGTPTQATMAGRRTSLFLRTRRAGTEEPEEENESRLRTPSRAVTEITRVKNSQREYTSQQPLPDVRSPTVQSSLPVRRHYASASLPTSGPPPSAAVQNLGARRFFDRSTPERETSGVVSRLAEDRGQRKSSIGGFGLIRRTRQNSVEAPQQGQAGYQ